MIASVPRRLAIEFVMRFGLRMIADPGGPSDVAVEAIWDRQQESEPAMKWLRDQIEVAAALVRGGS